MRVRSLPIQSFSTDQKDTLKVGGRSQGNVRRSSYTSNCMHLLTVVYPVKPLELSVASSLASSNSSSSFSTLCALP